MGRFRVISGPDIIGTFPDAEAIVRALTGAQPGLYVIEEVATAGELLPGGYFPRFYKPGMLMFSAESRGLIRVS